MLTLGFGGKFEDRCYHGVQERCKELKLLRLAHLSVFWLFPGCVDGAVIAYCDGTAGPLRLDEEVGLGDEAA